MAVDFTGGGGTATNALYQWHCNAEPGPQPPDGTVCDPGGAAHYQPIAVPGSMTFTVNATAVACGGWVCRDAGGVTTTLAPNDFLEGGVDLTVLDFTGCFHTFLPHTRTAQSFTATPTTFGTITTPVPLETLIWTVAPFPALLRVKPSWRRSWHPCHTPRAARAG